MPEPLRRAIQHDARRAADTIWLPPPIRGFVSRSGKLMHPSLQMAWGWLAHAVDRFPVEVEFKMAELGAYFCCRSAAQPTQWVQALEREGLLEIVERRPGRRGGVRARLLDPELVAELRVKRPSAQRELAIDVDELPPSREPDEPQTLSARSAWTEGFLDTIDDDEPPIDEQPGEVGKTGEHAAPTEQPETLSARSACAEGFDSCVAPGAPPVALLNALESHLGAGRAGVWLGRSRFELGQTPQLYLESEAMRDFVRRNHAAGIRAALAEAGYRGAVEFLVAADLPPPETLSASAPCAEGFRGGSAQQQAKASRTTSLGCSRSQPASQASDFWIEQRDGPEPSIVRAARELYDRVGDPTMMRGVALRVAVLQREGTLPADYVEQLIVERKFDFNVAVKQAAKGYWVHISRFKSHLAAAYGVNWSRLWDKPRQPRIERGKL